MTKPPQRIAYLRRHYPEALNEVALDVGCGHFVHLQNFAPGSVALDARSMSPPREYHFVKWNFLDEISDALAAEGHPSQFPVIWCSDLFEHVLSPHLFLLNLRRALTDNGVLFLGVPLVNRLAITRFQTRTNWINLFCGFLSQDHVNFFTFETIKHTARFAGLEVEAWYSPFLPMKRPIMTGIEPVTVLVLRKIPDWNYGPKAYKRLDSEGRMGWKEDFD